MVALPWIILFLSVQVYAILHDLSPFHKLDINNLLTSVVIPTVHCTELKPSISICAEDCFNEVKSQDGCIGFKGHTNGTCSLFHPLESTTSMSTALQERDSLYILKVELQKPDVHFSMDHLSISTQSLNENMVTAVQNLADRIELIDRKLNNVVRVHGDGPHPDGDDVYYHNGGNYRLSVAENKCFCNFILCTEQAMSISFWVKPYEHFGYGEMLVLEAGNYGTTIGAYSLIINNQK